jgi:hypothetical protein
MNLISIAGQYGLVLDTEDGTKNRIGAGQSEWAPAQEHTGHFILLNRYKVDDDGNICLTPSLALPDLYGTVEIFAAELQSLLEQARRRFPPQGHDELF